ncbi:MAG: AMP-binding protein [Prevotellaceae bacterium]|jgi:long-chain acyl-CoA synthetase|nr:AMP-binding protein [Prevotellaceae bacterium]
MKVKDRESLKTLKDLLEYSAERYASKMMNAFVGDKPVSYSEFGEKVNNLREVLKSLGIGHGDKVAIYTHNTPKYSVIYFAIVSMGAITVPLLPDFSSTEVENILKHSESKALFVTKRLRYKVDAIDLPELKIRFDVDTFSVYENRQDVENTAKSVEKEVLPDDIASIVYTSGTTGKSKGVMLTHYNLIVQLQMVIKIQPVDENSVFLSILPLPHAYEGSLGFLLPIFGGSSVYYLEKSPTPTILLPAMQKVKPTHILTVPLISEKIFKNNILAKFNKSMITRYLYKTTVGRKLLHRIAGKKLYKTFGGRLVFFGIGGAKLDYYTERFLYEAKFPYAIGYGLTETAPLLTAALSHNVKPGSAGFKLEEIDMKINDVNDCGIGELWIKSPCLMKGYYKEQELTDMVITPDGWFKTGDLVNVNSSGRIYIKGRLKNVILTSSGENVYPEDIESLINNFKFVQESLVVEQKGKLVAMVKINYDELGSQYNKFKEELQNKIEENYRELEKNIEELKLEIQLYVNSKVNRFSQISSVIVLPFASDFEKTSTMKIKRYLYA